MDRTLVGGVEPEVSCRNEYRERVRCLEDQATAGSEGAVGELDQAVEAVGGQVSKAPTRPDFSTEAAPPACRPGSRRVL